MKKNTLFFLPVFFLMLTGCGPKAPAREPLGKPVITVKTDKTGLTWEAVEGAVSYQVTVNQGQPQTVTDCSYTFSDEVGNYSVSVVAVADEAKYNSEAASYTYETKAAAIGELSVANGAITWASAEGTGLEYAVNGGLYTAVSGTSITATAAGVYTVRAKIGYDETNKKNYVAKTESVRERHILVQTPATDILVIEDGSEATSADLKDGYTIEQYKNGWEVTESADLTLSDYNAGYTEGNAVKVQFYKNDNAFRFIKNVAFAGAYDTLNFTIKGENVSEASFTVTLRVSEQKSIAGVGFQGVYMSYKVASIPSVWTKYTVSMADDAWTISFGGKDLTFAQVQAALAESNIKVNKLADLLPYFDLASFALKCPHDTNYSKAYMYVDEFEFSNAGRQSSQELYPIALTDHYAFESNALKGRLDKEGDNWFLSFPYSGQAVKLPVTCTTAGQKLTVKSTVTNYDFEAVCVSQDDAESFVLESATGTAAPLLTGLRAEVYYVVDNFEGYSNTDALKAAYYPDFYNGGNTSVIGGNGWSKMTSTDYLDLTTTEANVHSGAKSARVKYNASNQMRYTTFGLSDGTAKPLRHANYVSFWVKGVSTRANHIKFRLHYIQKLTPSTQSTDCKEVEVTIPKGEAWNEVVLKLDYARTYYGFSLLPIKESGSGQYFYVDDICIYRSITPWAQLKNNYAFRSAAVTGTMNKESGSWKLHIDGNSTALPVTGEVLANGKVEFVSTTENYDFKATFTSTDGYKNLTLESATGTAAAMLTNMVASSYQTINTFESYTATGVGYDKNHEAKDKSGLRGDFFSEYYSNNASDKSPMGGTKWSLMGSNDYLNLNTEAANVHSGAKSARFKYNASNQMRFFSWGLYDGSSVAYEKGSKLSMFVQGVSTRSNHLKIRAYYLPKVSNDAGNLDKYTEKEITIEQGTQWTEVAIDLAADKTYYGFAILPITGSGSGQYFFVDDICVYNQINPFAK